MNSNLLATHWQIVSPSLFFQNNNAFETKLINLKRSSRTSFSAKDGDRDDREDEESIAPIAELGPSYF